MSRTKYIHSFNILLLLRSMIRWGQVNISHNILSFQSWIFDAFVRSKLSIFNLAKHSTKLFTSIPMPKWSGLELLARCCNGFALRSYLTDRILIVRVTSSWSPWIIRSSTRIHTLVAFCLPPSSTAWWKSLKFWWATWVLWWQVNGHWPSFLSEPDLGVFGRRSLVHVILIDLSISYRQN